MSITAPQGFTASGVACGIKASGALDLSLVAVDDAVAVPAAGVFTSNRGAAAPVQVSRAHLAATGGRAAAVVLSSGNANAATGAEGKAHAERMCALVGHGMGVSTDVVLVCQTGLIGIPLPMAVVESGIPDLLAGRGADGDAAQRAARAIMTTDTTCKEVTVHGPGFMVGGMAKGAAMLAPNMATMLAVLTTDALCEPAVLAEALAQAVGSSFNAMTVDGCTSTNDTVLVLASGRAAPASGAVLAAELTEACGTLAQMMVGDAEGATKVSHVVVTGAASADEAHRAARRVADSLLVKCSLNGEDPYWGRVVSEIGSVAEHFDIDKVEVSYGGVVVCRQGVAVAHDAAAVADHMAGRSIEIRCDLGVGASSSAVLGTDLGYGYIDENRTTS